MKKQEINVLLFISAWTSTVKEDPQTILSYWMSRMSPMLKPNYKKDWLFICSDRVGKDGDTLFNGCSCVIKLQELKLIQCLSKDKEEAILIKTGKYRK